MAFTLLALKNVGKYKSELRREVLAVALPGKTGTFFFYTGYKVLDTDAPRSVLIVGRMPVDISRELIGRKAKLTLRGTFAGTPEKSLQLTPPAAAKTVNTFLVAQLGLKGVIVFP